jgi:hypothetical protein
VAAAVGKAAPRHDPAPIAHRLPELVDQARLADARVREQRYEPARPRRRDEPELGLELRKLVLTPDEGAVVAPRDSFGLVHRQQPVGRHGLRLPLQR